MGTILHGGKAKKVVFYINVFGTDGTILPRHEFAGEYTDWYHVERVLRLLKNNQNVSRFEVSWR